MRSKPEIPGTRGARDLIPEEPAIAHLREAAAECTACLLYRNATQTVFGEGPERAVVMLVGEQPGDAEDIAGHPFVGPAGKLLDRCLAEA
ncbi:MAG: uracil-DNA glycosylase, partial [Alphaproteobacteria bacterium]|nr:uracil-DNA glycosylase [Alphaproteobacteria bacterium]